MLSIFSQNIDKFLCLNCYALVDKPKKFEEIKCDNCGQVFTKSEVDFSEHNSSNSVYFGYMYGKRYDEQKEKYEKVIESYFLTPQMKYLFFLEN